MHKKEGLVIRMALQYIFTSRRKRVKSSQVKDADTSWNEIKDLTQYGAIAFAAHVYNIEKEERLTDYRLVKFVSVSSHQHTTK